MQRANGLLAEWINGSATASIPGAAHFMITTHAQEVASLLARHIITSAAQTYVRESLVD